MSKKFPKPFFVAARGIWRVQIQGKQYNLGPDEDQALKKYHQLMARPPVVASSLVAGIIEGFLDWCQRHRSPRTFEWYTNHLQSFVNSLDDPKSMAVDQLRPHHVHHWVDSKPTWGDMHQRGAIISVQRAFKWAETMGHISSSPVRHVEKPPPKRREQVLSKSEFDALVATVKDTSFRDVLEFCWETGCRVQELRLIEARHFLPDRGRVELPAAEAKGKKRWRMIYLTKASESILTKLVAKHRQGPVFRNVRGRPWTAQAFNCRFCRIQKKLGVKYALTVLRHSFATRLLEAGVDHVTVSTLMGHVDATMLARVYQHVGSRNDFLRTELVRASGGGTVA